MRAHGPADDVDVDRGGRQREHAGGPAARGDRDTETAASAAGIERAARFVDAGRPEREVRVLRARHEQRPGRDPTGAVCLAARCAGRDDVAVTGELRIARPAPLYARRAALHQRPVPQLHRRHTGVVLPEHRGLLAVLAVGIEGRAGRVRVCDRESARRGHGRRALATDRDGARCVRAQLGEHALEGGEPHRGIGEARGHPVRRLVPRAGFAHHRAAFVERDRPGRAASQIDADDEGHQRPTRTR